MSREFHVCGLGNSLVDIFLELTDDEFAALGFESGTMRLVEPAEQPALLGAVPRPRPAARQRRVGRQLGHRARPSSAATAAFIGCVGDDRYGLHYQREFEELGIDIRQARPSSARRPAPACASSRRTPSGRCGPAWRCPATWPPGTSTPPASPPADWLFVEGYVFANPDTGQDAIREAVRRRQGQRRQGRADLLGGVHPAGLRGRVRRGPEGRPTCSSATPTEALRRDQGRRRPRRRSPSSRVWCPRPW